MGSSLIDTQVHVAIPSYKRAGEVLTLDVAPFAWVWVPESQGDDYRKHYGDRVITIPDELDGNSARKRNAILDKSPCPWVVLMDDDVTKFTMFEGGRRHTLNPSGVARMIERGFELAYQLGVRIWGINTNSDPIAYRCFTPLALLSPVLGPFLGILGTELRYDEWVRSKDDYDFWIQHIHKDHQTLRLNMYNYYHKIADNAGGTVSIRSQAYEKEGIQRMRVKWGDKVFTGRSMSGGRSSTGMNTLNTIVKAPIPGC